MTPTFKHVGATAILLLIHLAAAAGGAPASGLALDRTDPQLRAVLRSDASWAGIRRLLIEYDVRSLAAPTHMVMALASSGEIYTLSAHFPQGGYPWQMDPFAQEFFVHKGATCHRWPFNRIFSQGALTNGSAIPGSFPQDVLLPVLPIWPLSAYKPPVEPVSSAILPPGEALRSGRSRFVRGPEPVSGQQCVVFERKGVDRIWVAVGKGACVMRREIWDPRFGQVRQRILTDKISEVAPGLWMPTDYRRQYLSLLPGTNGELSVVLDFKVRVLRWLLNKQVPASTFVPAFKPGTLRYGPGEQFTQVTPGGRDLLSNIVDLAVTYGHLPTRPLARGRRYAWLLAGLLAGVGTGLIWRTGPRRGPPPRDAPDG